MKQPIIKTILSEDILQSNVMYEGTGADIKKEIKIWI